ncbi:hypothetical protein GGS24DRAFT_475923 [Hypoxylon argillaceum]|nr:hypothetical protein GGS24DRAFT_475923 [Hypoxylon argillaceum]
MSYRDILRHRSMTSALLNHITGSTDPYQRPRPNHPGPAMRHRPAYLGTHRRYSLHFRHRTAYPSVLWPYHGVLLFIVGFLRRRTRQQDDRLVSSRCTQSPPQCPREAAITCLPRVPGCSATSWRCTIHSSLRWPETSKTYSTSIRYRYREKPTVCGSFRR